MVKIQYKSKGKPILTIADAIQNNSFYDFPGKESILTVGNAYGVYDRLCVFVCVSVCVTTGNISNNTVVTVVVLDAISNSAHTISGDISLGTQYHFHMETQVWCVCIHTSAAFTLHYHGLQTSLCIPEDDSYTVYSSTQWPDACQLAVSNVLGIPNNKYSLSIKCYTFKYMRL